MLYFTIICKTLMKNNRLKIKKKEERKIYNK